VVITQPVLAVIIRHGVPIVRPELAFIIYSAEKESSINFCSVTEEDLRYGPTDKSVRILEFLFVYGNRYRFQMIFTKRGECHFVVGVACSVIYPLAL